jgi:acyl carrier protein
LKEKVGLDPNLIVQIVETEGDSLDLVEVAMAIEAAFGSRLKK